MILCLPPPEFPHPNDNSIGSAVLRGSCSNPAGWQTLVDDGGHEHQEIPSAGVPGAESNVYDWLVSARVNAAGDAIASLRPSRLFPEPTDR